MSHDLTEIEQKHGFRFGDPDRNAHDAGAALKGTLVCTNTACKHYRVHVAFHEDTILPIHCGGCFNILVEDPNRGPDASLVVVDDGAGFREFIREEARRIIAEERAAAKAKKKHR